MTALSATHFQSPRSRGYKRPLWLRPVLFTVIAAVHVAPFLARQIQIDIPSAPESINIEMVAQGESAVQVESSPELSKEETIEAAPMPKDVLAPVDHAIVTAPQAAIENPDAIVVPKEVEKIDPLPVKPPLPEPPKPVEVKAPEEKPVPKPPIEKKPIAPKRSYEHHKNLVQREKREGAQATRFGVREGKGAGGGLSTATYKAMLLQQVAVHKFTPPGAEAGAVSVSFSIGAGGQVTSASASGSGIIADAARRIVRSIRVPPPPGGSFHGSVTIRFDHG